MAKNKSKGKKKHTRRHKRVGAMALTANSPLVQYGSIIGGFLLADQINSMLDKVTGTMDAKIVGGLEAGLGAALSFNLLKMKKKSVIATAGGGILLGAGAKRLGKALGLINGFQDVPVVGTRRRMNGYRSVPVIGGYNSARIPVPTGGGALNGYAVPAPAGRVMGSIGTSGSGSGLMATPGSELMN